MTAMTSFMGGARSLDNVENQCSYYWRHGQGLSAPAAETAGGRLNAVHNPQERIPSSRFRLPLPQQALLRHRGDQSPIASEDLTPGEAARATEIGAVFRIQQPLVGAERPMKPQRVVEACRHNVLIEHGFAERHEGSVEQSHVGGIGENALMDRRLVR